MSLITFELHETIISTSKLRKQFSNILVNICLSPCSFEHLKAKDTNFEQRYANLGNIYFKQGVTEFNWDSNVEDGLSTDH